MLNVLSQLSTELALSTLKLWFRRVMVLPAAVGFSEAVGFARRCWFCPHCWFFPQLSVFPSLVGFARNNQFD